MRRHRTPVNHAFSFCWDAYLDQPPREKAPEPHANPPRPEDVERGEPESRASAHRLLAQSAPPGTRLAHPLDHAATLVAGMVERTSATTTTSPDRHGGRRPGLTPLPPELTNHRQWVYFTVTDLLNLEVDLLFFDTTSTYFELNEPDEPEPRDCGGRVTETTRRRL